MAETHSKADWVSALSGEDGQKLSTLLAEDPRLLTVSCHGCNVLHLAIRNRWYSLVDQIMWNFEHLQRPAPRPDANSSSRLDSADHTFSVTTDFHGGSGRGDHETRRGPALDLTTFRDLLTAKEGEGEPPCPMSEGGRELYASGFDVFAMALIQGHRTINARIGKAVSSVDGLFDHNHRYENVLLRIDENHPDFGMHKRTRPQTGDGHEREKEMLRTIVKDFFGKSSTEVDSDREPVPIEASEGSPSVKFEDEIHQRWVDSWNLTSPFLPLEEFLFLACCDGTVSRYSKLYSTSDAPDPSTVLRRCADWKADAAFMRYLLTISDSRGTALHNNLLHEPSDSSSLWWDVYNLIPKGDDFKDCINKSDSSGRTPFLTACALGHYRAFEFLCEDSRTDVNDIWDPSDCGFWEFAGFEWEVDVNTISEVNRCSPEGITVLCAYILLCSFHGPDRKLYLELLLKREDLDLNVSYYWVAEDIWVLRTGLQLAAYVGNAEILSMLAHDDRAYDPTRLNNLYRTPGKNFPKGILHYSALHIAARAGHRTAIKFLLDTRKFDAVAVDKWGKSALHYATRVEFPFKQYAPYLTEMFLIPTKPLQAPHQRKGSPSAQEREKILRVEENRRQGCIELLLHGGIDMWPPNKDGQVADPGPEASREYSTWWYEKLSKETQEVKTNLNAAANAISVVAALVATASYVGPLQPPLGYTATTEDGINKIQVDIVSVRTFIVANTLAFYFALAAIMLSMIPSMPMPKDEMVDELKLIRRMVTAAVSVLIMSIVFILLAFTSASIAIIPDEGDWNRGNLTAGPVGLGGLICFVAWMLCTLRLFRFIFRRQAPKGRLRRWIWRLAVRLPQV